MKSPLSPLSASEVNHAQARASERRLANAPRLQRVARLSWLLLPVYAFLFANECHYFQRDGGQLQTRNADLNDLIYIIVMLLPTVVFLLNLVAPHTPTKVFTVAALFFLAGFSALMIPTRNFPFRASKPVPLKSLPLSAHTIRCFRKQGLFDCFVEVRGERQMLPGVVWSLPLHREKRAVDVVSMYASRDQLHCLFAVGNDMGELTPIDRRSVTIPIR